MPETPAFPRKNGGSLPPSFLSTFEMAGPTGLEPATSGVTGLRSNQLNYDPVSKEQPLRADAHYTQALPRRKRERPGGQNG